MSSKKCPCIALAVLLSLVALVTGCSRYESPATATASPSSTSTEPSTTMATRHATFAGGCFWGVQHIFEGVPGVVDTQVGYTGGKTSDPSYEDVCTDKTGHAESVQITYDPSKVSYEQLLAVFWHAHDPTELNRQGPDVGTQYRSAIFTHSATQEAAAKLSLEQLKKSGRFPRPIVTQIVPAGQFWRAEDYHQHFIDKHPERPCHVLDEPLEKILASAPAPGSPGAVADRNTQAEACPPTGGCSADYYKSRTDAEWRKLLTPEQYKIARQAGTERAFSGKYWNTHTPGTYVCAVCGQPLFSSKTKFNSGTGWPSFYAPISPDAIKELKDTSAGMTRTEIRCSRCDSHLGHVFDDGPPPTGKRYCLNSAVLKLIPETQSADAKGTTTGHRE